MNKTLVICLHFTVHSPVDFYLSIFRNSSTTCWSEPRPCDLPVPVPSETSQAREGHSMEQFSVFKIATFQSPTCQYHEYLGNSSHNLGHAILYKKVQSMDAKTAWKAQKVTKIKNWSVCEFWKDKITWSLLNIKFSFCERLSVCLLMFLTLLFTQTPLSCEVSPSHCNMANTLCSVNLSLYYIIMYVK